MVGSAPNVAHLLPSLALGGKERIVLDLARRAHDRGANSIIITYDRTNDTTEFTPGPVQRVTIDRRQSREAYRGALLQSLRAHSIDVLHAHGHVAAVYAEPAAGLLPILATMHVALGTDRRWVYSIWRALRRADRLTAVSADLASRFSRLTRRPVSVVPPGIDYGSYSSASMPSAGGALRLGMAARLHPVKRHVDAIDAVRLLVAAGVPVSLSLAGEGPLLEQLRAYSDGLPLEFLGAVANVEQFYRSIDAFVLCSDHEGSPVALLEAMAAGLPCIVTHVGGIPELVTDADGKKCALMVPKRSPRALASKIADLAAAPGLRTQLGRMASSRAAFFSLEAQERAYEEIYAAMISEARFR